MTSTILNLSTRRVRARACTSAVVFLAAAFAAGAQEVRVEVVKHADGKPIPGALVVVLPERESGPAGRFSDREGRAKFTTPRRGGYRVRAEKIGYDTWVSVVLVPSSVPTRVRIGMKPRSLRLPPLSGKGETQCSSIAGQATVAGAMWGEIRKALAANSLTESQGLAPLDIDSYDRIVDPGGRVVSERSARRRGVRPYGATDSPQNSPGATGQPVYSVPEASTLLSEQFVSTHCFTGIRGTGPETGLIGLEFKPAKLGSNPDLSGILWLDPTTYSLRHLVFDYVNRPVALRAGPPMGRVDFQQLSGGEWIVTRWHLRIPRGAARSTSAANTMTGYHEIGAVARSVGPASRGPDAAGASAAPASTPGGETRITGSVFDGTTGTPLSGVDVSTFSRSHRTTTNRGGGYELSINGPLTDSIVFDHPRLRLLRVARVKPVTVAAGGRAQVSVAIPSIAPLMQALCPGSGSSLQPSGLAIGYVRDEAGNPVADAQVTATWQVLWIEERGRLVSTNQRRSAEGRTAPDGSYLLCGFTRNAPVNFRVTVDGTARVEESLPIPRSLVVERDFRLPAR